MSRYHLNIQQRRTVQRVESFYHEDASLAPEQTDSRDGNRIRTHWAPCGKHTTHGPCAISPRMHL